MFRLIFILGFALSLSLQARQPNVLLIMTDDQGWGDVRAHGNEFIDTPVLDGLAKRSVRFDRFFVSPVCAPTRAALLTGRYPARTVVMLQASLANGTMESSIPIIHWGRGLMSFTGFVGVTGTSTSTRNSSIKASPLRPRDTSLM